MRKITVFEGGHPMKILVIRLSSIGDIVLTQPVVAALQAYHPQCEIHYLTKSAFIPVVRSFGMPLAIHAYEELQSVAALISFGNLHRFDLVLDLHNKLSTFIIKNLIRGRQTFTYNKKHGLRRRIVQHKTSEKIASTIELYCTALHKAGIECDVTPPVLHPDTSVRSAALSALQRLKSEAVPLIGLFPGAQHNTKQYPIEQLAKAITLLASERPCRFAVLGSASERHLAQQLMEHVSVELHDFCGAYTLAELISAVDLLDAVVTNDSGPMHIAAALAKPQVAIFGSTHPHLGFAPHNSRAIILGAPLGCRPCSLHGGEECPLGHFDCMHSITPEDVANAVKDLQFL